ncbi:MAG: pseudouridine synthase [Planctomycetes bacterium]|nr:pseudouridine synthase [Planctomycetota bacterium]
MRARVVALWKPYGHLSQWTPRAGHPGLGDLLAADPGGGRGPRGPLRAVGRLDHDSEGLLLLTDDGALTHRLTDPRFAHPRTYWAQVERVPDDEALRRLARGVALGDGTTRPAAARLLDGEPPLPPRDPPIRARKTVPTAWLELTLTEGRNRQVRRMTAAVGHPTLRLVRVAVGRLRLLDLGLAPGASRDLGATEVRAAVTP